MRTEVYPCSVCLFLEWQLELKHQMLWFQQLNLSLASLLASAETSLNSFARELGFFGRGATDLFLFGQNE